ncbi:hypothetical protein [Mesorhizobium sp. C416B]|uniref:hypothetical protein n=1 Tax=Mesorhizobium sp. C416B TaxID=2956834 RepID=UPI0004210E3A
MLVRNVGHQVPEEHHGRDDGGDRAPRYRHKGGRRANSPAGSMYVVTPRMHGPAEVAFAVELFSRVQQVLGMMLLL